MLTFGKLNFSTSFNPTSAFPLDARCYFTSLADAQAAARSAEQVGSTNTVYYYGMRLVVDDGSSVKWYTIQRDNNLLEDGTAAEISASIESLVERLIAQRLSQIIVVGPNEPENGPCLWFDTSIDDDPDVGPDGLYLVLDDDLGLSEVSIDIDDAEYAVLNTDSPVLADDGSTVQITVSK